MENLVNGETRDGDNSSGAPAGEASGDASENPRQDGQRSAGAEEGSSKTDPVRETANERETVATDRSAASQDRTAQAGSVRGEDDHGDDDGHADSDGDNDEANDGGDDVNDETSGDADVGKDPAADDQDEAAPSQARASDAEATDEDGDETNEGDNEEGRSVSDDVSEEHLSEFTVRRRAHVAPALISLDHVDEDTTFRVRTEGDVHLLATDIARVGQLFPIEVRLRPPDRFQVISGFRRLAALRFLHRDKVLARLHVELSDDDALLMSLAAAIHARPVSQEELESVKARLETEGRLSAAARDMLEKALAPDDNLAPEEVGEQEVDADELAADVASRLGTINQELALLADVFDSLDEGRRAELLMQLRYSSELVAFLEGK